MSDHKKSSRGGEGKKPTEPFESQRSQDRKPNSSNTVSLPTKPGYQIGDKERDHHTAQMSIERNPFLPSSKTPNLPRSTSSQAPQMNKMPEDIIPVAKKPSGSNPSTSKSIPTRDMRQKPYDSINSTRTGPVPGPPPHLGTVVLRKDETAEQYSDRGSQYMRATKQERDAPEESCRNIDVKMQKSKEAEGTFGSFDASRKYPMVGTEGMGSKSEGTSARLDAEEGKAKEKADEMTDANLDEILAHENKLSKAGATGNVRAMGEPSQNNKVETARKYPAVTTFPPPGMVSQQPLPPLTSQNLALQSSGYRMRGSWFGYIAGSLDGTNVEKSLRRPAFTISAIFRQDYAPPLNPFSNSSINPHYPITTQSSFTLPGGSNKPPIPTKQTAAEVEGKNESEEWEIITSSDEDELKTGDLKDWDLCVDAEIDMRDLRQERMRLGGNGRGKK